MARTPLFRALRRAARGAVAANRLELPAGKSHDTEEIAEAAAAARHPLTRRQFLARSALTAGAVAVGASWLSACAGKESAPPSGDEPSQRREPTARVAIVGGGIAGLTCAYRLRAHPELATDLYEAGTRFGGRIFSNRDAFRDHGLVCEMGGELINSNHPTMLGLAREFGLELTDRHVENEGLDDILFQIHGGLLTEGELVSAFRPLAAKMQRDFTEAYASEEAYAALDATSLAEYLDRVDLDPKLRALIEMAYVSEMGLEADAQSALLLFYLIDFESDDAFNLLGESDERYHVRDGNDRIISNLVERLPQEHLHLEHGLLRLRQKAESGTYVLSFAHHNFSSTVEVEADFVVLALPFSTLREVDLDGVELPEVKQRLIREIAYGTNAKLMLGTTARPWRTEQGTTGSAVTDIGEGGLQVVWDTSVGQHKERQQQPGIITNFVGGTLGERIIAEGSAEAQAQRVLPLIESLYPGTQASFTGQAVRMHWPSAPFAKGSYVCFQPGFVSLAEEIGTPVGRIHFCGEHCSLAHQGYMEGAAETGAAAAEAVVKAAAATTNAAKVE